MVNDGLCQLGHQVLKVPPPPRRVLGRSVAVGLGRVEHAFDVASGGVHGCTRTALDSTGDKFAVKIHCEEKQEPVSTSSAAGDRLGRPAFGPGTMTDYMLVVEAIGTENVRGTKQVVITSADGLNLNMNSTFTSMYRGPACGDVK